MFLALELVSNCIFLWQNETWIEALKEESALSEEEDEEEDQESHRLRFKTERKDASAVPLSSVADKRRNIPETLGTPT